MRVAHISDLHILDLTGVTTRQFLNRRIAGGMNLILRRAREFRPEILEILVEDLIQEGVDHVLVSGDVSSLAFEPEFQRVFDLLKLLGNRGRVSVVPGNHDYYTYHAAEVHRFEKTFYPFMFDRDFSDLNTDIYPYIKPLDDLVVVGINSATRTVPPLSYGAISDAQFQRLQAILQRYAGGKRPVCLLLHHALHRRDPVTQATSRLIQAERLLNLIDEFAVELVLYGHDHHSRLWKRESEKGVTQFICCGSSTRLVDDPSKVARYHIVLVEEGRVRRVDTKVYDPAIRRFMPS